MDRYGNSRAQWDKAWQSKCSNCRASRMRRTVECEALWNVGCLACACNLWMISGNFCSADYCRTLDWSWPIFLNIKPRIDSFGICYSVECSMLSRNKSERERVANTREFVNSISMHTDTHTHIQIHTGRLARHIQSAYTTKSCGFQVENMHATIVSHISCVIICLRNKTLIRANEYANTYWTQFEAFASRISHSSLNEKTISWLPA